MTISKPEKPIRHHVDAHDIRYWSKHWKVAPDEIRAAVETAGNSAAAVQKELRLRGLIEKWDEHDAAVSGQGGI